MKTIDYQIDKDGIAILTLDVKDKPMNVMTPEFMADIKGLGAKIAADEKAKGAVLTSRKDSICLLQSTAPFVDFIDIRITAEDDQSQLSSLSAAPLFMKSVRVMFRDTGCSNNETKYLVSISSALSIGKTVPS